MNKNELCGALVEKCLQLERLNINHGMAGNLSVRHGDTMFITPSGVPYDKLTAEMVALMPIETDYGAWTGPLAPSSEWRMHLDIMRARPEVGAVIHTHALYATTLSILHKPIPAVHYMIAAFGGTPIRCTKYAPFGTKELSDLAIQGLTGRHGVLLGQHGMLTTGRDLDEGMWRAVELEALAKMYVLALGIGHPKELPEAEVMRIVERFKSYGYQPREPAHVWQRAKKSPAAGKTVSLEGKTARKRKADAKRQK